MKAFICLFGKVLIRSLSSNPSSSCSIKVSCIKLPFYVSHLSKAHRHHEVIVQVSRMIICSFQSSRQPSGRFKRRHRAQGQRGHSPHQVGSDKLRRDVMVTSWSRQSTLLEVILLWVPFISGLHRFREQKVLQHSQRVRAHRTQELSIHSEPSH